MPHVETAIRRVHKGSHNWLPFLYYIYFTLKKESCILKIQHIKKRSKDMAKKLTKKELEKMKLQMCISSVKHDQPPVGRPTVFYGKTNKQKRKEGRMQAKQY